MAWFDLGFGLALNFEVWFDVGLAWFLAWNFVFALALVCFAFSEMGNHEVTILGWRGHPLWPHLKNNSLATVVFMIGQRNVQKVK